MPPPFCGWRRLRSTMKVPINEFDVIDLDAPVLPAYERAPIPGTAYITHFGL